MVARSSNATKYTGVEPKAFDADALRRSVPDDPIRLGPGHLACEGCGVAHAGEVVYSLPMDTAGRFAAQFTRCPDCQRLHDHAAGDRTTLNVLYALAVIGQDPPEDPAPLIQWMRVMGSAVPWAEPEAPSSEWCNPHPWAHVTLRQRAAIREAYVLALRSRIRVGAPSLLLPPPWGRACQFCGVASLPMPPLEVVRRGGRENAAFALWRRVLVQPSSLGGHGPALVDGFVCPPCSEALDSVGTVGVRARAKAFEKYVREHRPAEADRVRSLLDFNDQIILPGWGALPTVTPNPEPWAHIAVPELEDDAL